MYLANGEQLLEQQSRSKFEIGYYRVMISPNDPHLEFGIKENAVICLHRHPLNLFIIESNDIVIIQLKRQCLQCLWGIKVTGHEFA